MTLLVLPLLAASAAWSESPLLRYAPPESSFVLGMNVRALLETAAGKAMLAEARNSAELSKFTAQTGLDPLKDIDEILVAGEATQKKNNGLVLVRGRFASVQMAQLATQNFTPAMFRGVEIYTRSGDEPVSVAVLNPALLVAGDTARVKALIGRGPGAGPSAALAAKAAELAPMHIWFAAVTPASQLAGDLPKNMNSELMRSIEQVSGGITFTNDIALAVELMARTPKDAESIAGMARMFTGLAVSNNRDAKQAAALLEKLSIRNDGNSVRLNLTLPQAEVARWAQQARAQAAAHQPAVAPPPPAPTEIKVYSSPEDMGTVTLPPPK
jgi:hypothetical protein